MSTLGLCPCGEWLDDHTFAEAEAHMSLLISPECREGWHRECPGDPCECTACHLNGDPGVAP